MRADRSPVFAFTAGRGRAGSGYGGARLPAGQGCGNGQPLLRPVYGRWAQGWGSTDGSAGIWAAEVSKMARNSS